MSSLSSGILNEATFIRKNVKRSNFNELLVQEYILYKVYFKFYFKQSLLTCPFTLMMNMHLTHIKETDTSKAVFLSSFGMWRKLYYEPVRSQPLSQIYHFKPRSKAKFSTCATFLMRATPADISLTDVHRCTWFAIGSLILYQWLHISMLAYFHIPQSALVIN